MVLRAVREPVFSRRRIRPLPRRQADGGHTRGADGRPDGDYRGAQRVPYEAGDGDEDRLTLPEYVYATYNALLENGWRMKDIDEMDMVLSKGFIRSDQTENIMELDLEREFGATLPEGYKFVNPDPVKDIYELSWLFWQGFDHGEDKIEFEQEGIDTPRARKHFNRDLCVAACNDEGELVSICGLWYNPKTDYVYVEPVCTIPSCRGQGVAKAVIYEAMNRAKSLGAKRAFVISDMDFYFRLGFINKYHYTFYSHG